MAWSMSSKVSHIFGEYVNLSVATLLEREAHILLDLGDLLGQIFPVDFLMAGEEDVGIEAVAVPVDVRPGFQALQRCQGFFIVALQVLNPGLDEILKLRYALLEHLACDVVERRLDILKEHLLNDLAEVIANVVQDAEVSSSTLQDSFEYDILITHVSAALSATGKQPRFPPFYI